MNGSTGFNMGAQDEEFGFSLGDDDIVKSAPVYPPALANMEVDIVVNKNSEVWILHNKPFEESIAWIEFDADDDTLTFVSYRGTVKGLGAKIQAPVRKYLYNAKRVFLIQTEGGKIYDFFNVALVVRDASTKDKDPKNKKRSA
ncbi:hypothetical protein [Micavibrio aeruginosavorus]|nr:hypothetical protein [Micavibrio aeruginosavorus]